jgi:putative membrane protein
VLVLALAAYLWGVHRVHRRGGRWPVRRTLAFTALGLGSYAVVELGFLGTFSTELRFAFTTRIALLLFAVPTLVTLGRPLELARRAASDQADARIDRVLASRPIRLLGNAMFAAIFSALVFCLFLTPIAGVARTVAPLDTALGVIVPLVGLVLVIPIAENAEGRTAVFLTVEFLLVFVELIIDAIPGIILRLSPTILDGAAAAHGLASWWPNPLRDQQLAGDLLWFIAEAADVPVLVLLFVRWARSDRRDARRFDELSDEELDALTQQHLRGPRD